MTYLLDTNVVSELRKARSDANVIMWMEQQDAESLYLSAVTIYEIEIGIRRVQRRESHRAEQLRRWLEGYVLPVFAGRVLPLDLGASKVAAALQVPNPCPERDCFLAATALHHGMTVVTRNVRDFATTGVSLINPWGTTN